LYAVGLPWLTGHGSSILAGVGHDAEYIAQRIAGHIAAR
jgi:putative flavoprotein involved in K+ transport